MTPVEAVLVVLIPEFEPLVAPFRLKHDPSAAMGVPAHFPIHQYLMVYVVDLVSAVCLYISMRRKSDTL
jgi:hypothetical protein